MLGLHYEVKTKTKIIDRGANNLFRQLEMLGDGTSITSGIHMPEGGELPTYNGKVDGKTPIAQYAFWNEYGTRHIPPRPAFRLTVENRKKQFYRESMTDMKRLTRGGQVRDMLNTNAKKIATWIKTEIWKLRTPPNRPNTLAWKKKLGRGTNPLIFSGSMRNSVTSKVHENRVKDRKLRRIVNKINRDIMRLTP